MSLADAGLYLDATSMLLRKVPATSPSKAMQQFLGRARFGMFLHFGMDTFADEELTDGQIPASVYNPPGIDASEWVRTAREGGMDYVLLICKHHDGFCNWPTRNNPYSVAQSGNPTDVVKAVADACAAQNMRFGVYYSLWDRRWDFLNQCGEHDNWNYTTQQNDAYREYMLQHLSELFTNYGPVVALWLDGSWAKSPDGWGLARIYDLVKRLQPECQIGVNGTMLDADHAKAFPSDFRLQDPYYPLFPDNKLAVFDGQTYYLPWQTTITLNQHWFWHATDSKIRSVDELEYGYYKATGQDNAFVINSPPDMAGRMRADNMDRLAALRERLGLRPGGLSPYPVNLSPAAVGAATSTDADSARFGAQQALGDDPDSRWAAGADATTCVLTQTFAASRVVDRVVLGEHDADPAGGGRYAVRRYSVEALTSVGWVQVAAGGGIGRSSVIDLAAVSATALRVSFLEASGPPSLWAFWAFSYPAPSGC